MKLKLRWLKNDYVLSLLITGSFFCVGINNNVSADDGSIRSDMKYLFRTDIATRYAVEYTVETLNEDEYQEEFSVKGFLDIQHNDVANRDKSVVDISCILVSYSVHNRAIDVSNNKQVSLRAAVNINGGIIFEGDEPDKALKSSAHPDANARILRGMVVIFPVLPEPWNADVVTEVGGNRTSYTYSIAEPFTITGRDNAGTRENGLFITTSSHFNQGEIESGSMRYVKYQNGMEATRCMMSVSAVSVTPRMVTDLHEQQELSAADYESAVNGEDKSISEETAEIISLKNRLNELFKQYTDSHPLIMQLKQEIRELETVKQGENDFH